MKWFNDHLTLPDFWPFSPQLVYKIAAPACLRRWIDTETTRKGTSLFCRLNWFRVDRDSRARIGSLHQSGHSSLRARSTRPASSHVLSCGCRAYRVREAPESEGGYFHRNHAGE